MGIQGMNHFNVLTDDVEATSVKLIHAMSGLDQPKNVIPMSTAQQPANGGHVAP